MIAGTQFFVPIEEIKSDLIFLKDGGITMVISTSAVNFGLLFETEQISIIDAFAGLLNSLSFPIQIVIHSKRMDASVYLHTIDQAIKRQTNPVLKDMTAKYREFVEGMIKENNVLDKQFYVCLHTTPAELGLFAGHTNEERAKKALTVLKPRCDHLIRQFGRLGLKAHQLDDRELLRLFYEIYNPALSEAPVKVIKPKPGEKGRAVPRNLVSHFLLDKSVSITPQQLVSQPSPQPPTPIPTQSGLIQPGSDLIRSELNPFAASSVSPAPQPGNPIPTQIETRSSQTAIPPTPIFTSPTLSPGLNPQPAAALSFPAATSIPAPGPLTQPPLTSNYQQPTNNIPFVVEELKDDA